MKHRKLFINLTLSLLLMTFAFPLKGEGRGDIPIKGFHIDLRCQVMTMPALRDFAKELSEFGINTLLMEWEATFPFHDNYTLSNSSAYTEGEIDFFINYCSTIGIEVIPLQNCFGHSEYILKHDRYSHLKEERKEVSQICPSKEKECVEVFRSIFSEIAAKHPSKYIHIGGDETYLLGNCMECAAKSAEEGKSKLFVDYINAMCKIIDELGKTPIIWADMIIKHPEAFGELPKNIILMDWNYGWKNDYFGDIGKLYAAGVNFWGSPSIRSHPDNIYLTQWKKHFKNQEDFIPYCREKKYGGIIMTSWSTGGTYGYKYDTNWEVISSYPIRYVYPLSGFRILVASYAAALKSESPINTEEFIKNYAMERFGVSKAEAETLDSMFALPQNIVTKGVDTDGKTLQQLILETDGIYKKISSIKVKNNKKEFSHYPLMLEIRIEYLKFKEIESRFESNSCKKEDTPLLLNQLDLLLRNSAKISKKFKAINKGFLYDKELNEICSLRVEKMNQLYDIIKNMVR